ncbi:hypothetical protein GE061_001390 [Apolygus lucorum]|uniref:Uncharacterized protein n=1 Tax=Apolygus lucorum TaxID=248454 RepID=A0A8S9Y6W9_APOLU|nr:hypothetical protein GE061_001390 [Apolygus lucorum]
MRRATATETHAPLHSLPYFTERKAAIQQSMDPPQPPPHHHQLANKPEIELLTEIGKVLEERSKEIETHKDLSLRVVDMKQKVRREKEQIESKWTALIEQEKKECELLTAEKLQLETQMKHEQQAGGSNTNLHKLVMDTNKDKGNKPAPGRVGNYTIMAKRLQGEIKQLESSVNDMKTRLQQEIEKKAIIETKVKEMRSSLTLHRRQDPFSAPTTPTN